MFSSRKNKHLIEENFVREKCWNFQKNSSIFLDEIFPDNVHINSPNRIFVEVNISRVFLFAVWLDLICLPSAAVGIYNSFANTRKMCEICSKLAINIPPWRHLKTLWCLYCELWTYFSTWFSASIVNFEQVNLRICSHTFGKV